MSKYLQRDLDLLQGSMLSMAGLVEETVHKATSALIGRDAALAREAISADARIDEEENNIDEECLRLLALHQPVAIDLRRIASAMMIVIDLERMGDLAEEIAEKALILIRHPQLSIPPQLTRMTELTTTMVRKSLDCFVSLDVEQARRIHGIDDEVSAHGAEIIEHLTRTMKESPEMVEPALALYSATKHLERISGHATNIAEDVLYLALGEIVRHRPDALNGDDDDSD